MRQNQQSIVQDSNWVKYFFEKSSSLAVGFKAPNFLTRYTIHRFLLISLLISVALNFFLIAYHLAFFHYCAPPVPKELNSHNCTSKS